MVLKQALIVQAFLRSILIKMIIIGPILPNKIHLHDYYSYKLLEYSAMNIIHLPIPNLAEAIYTLKSMSCYKHNNHHSYTINNEV